MSGRRAGHRAPGVPDGRRSPAERRTAWRHVAALALRLGLLFWTGVVFLTILAVAGAAHGRAEGGWAAAFTLLTYVAPFVSAVAALWSRRLAAPAGGLLAAGAAGAAAITWRTGAFGAGAAALRSDLGAVAALPALSAAVLLAAARLSAGPRGSGLWWLDRYFGD